jgi:glutathione S-transferase
MLEELGVPYEIQHYQRDAKTMLAPASLKKVHPLGKSPVITDGDLVVAESGAIIEYLAHTYGKDTLLPPTGGQARLDYTYWLHYAEGSIMPPLVMRLVFEKVKTSPMPFFVKPVAKGISDKTNEVFIGPMIKTHLDFVESHLAESTWFLGDDLSAADIQMSFPLEASVSRGIVGKGRPHIDAWVERVHARPAYQRALENGGSYDFA